MTNFTLTRQSFPSYWSDTNPHWMRANNVVKAEKVVVWGGIYDDKIIGPYFFEANVNGESYLELLGNFLMPEMVLAGINPEECYFQQDGASPHFSVDVRDWLDENLPNWIGRAGPVPWPARSPDLTPMDFFFWGYIKHLVYEHEPKDLNDLRNRIRRAFQSVSVETLHKVHLQFIKRIDKCIIAEGGHVECMH